jgi:hypothetical protein
MRMPAIAMWAVSRGPGQRALASQHAGSKIAKTKAKRSSRNVRGSA